LYFLFSVTGHSLGGALSTFAVADLISHGYKVDQYYNLGSPRVGDKKFY
jgi:predicted lipase